MTKPLVVVESPTKVKTIKKYLGKDYNVAATVGHIKDLPSKEMGIDIESGFKPKYKNIPGKQKIIKKQILIIFFSSCYSFLVVGFVFVPPVGLTSVLPACKGCFVFVVESSVGGNCVVTLERVWHSLSKWSESKSWYVYWLW